MDTNTASLSTQDGGTGVYIQYFSELRYCAVPSVAIPCCPSVSILCCLICIYTVSHLYLYCVVTSVFILCCHICNYSVLSHLYLYCVVPSLYCIVLSVSILCCPICIYTVLSHLYLISPARDRRNLRHRKFQQNKMCILPDHSR